MSDGIRAIRNAPEIYDCVAELRRDSFDDVLADPSPERQADGMALLEDERKFIDLPRSPPILQRGESDLRLVVRCRDGLPPKQRAAAFDHLPDEQARHPDQEIARAPHQRKRQRQSGRNPEHRA